MPTESATPEAEQEANSPVLVGQLLFAERQRQNLSEKEVADKLHITMHYVRALESNRFDKLPGAVFAKGYVKSYALLLGLDVETVLARYIADISDDGESSQEAEELRARGQLLKSRVAIAAVLLLATGSLTWWLQGSADRDSLDSSEGSVPLGQQVLSEQAADNQIQNRSPAETIAAVDAESGTSAEPSASDTAAVIENVAAETSGSGQSQSSLVNANPLLEAGRTASEFALLGSNPATTADTEADSPIAPLEDSAPSFERAEESEEVTDTIIAITSEGTDLLRILFTGESWVEVSDVSSGQVYRDLRGAGDVLEITGTAPFNILLGDAVFTTLNLNGAEIDVSDEIRIDNSARLTVGL